jgi:hypothetical protein
MKTCSCIIKQLPAHLKFKASRDAAIINPVNSPPKHDLNIERLVLNTNVYWGSQGFRASVEFKGLWNATEKKLFLKYANNWSKWGNVEYYETTGKGDIRVAKKPNEHWSYLGTDNKQIPDDEPTMNIGLSSSDSDEEWQRVVEHEVGHYNGMEHEQLRLEFVKRIDPSKAYPYFWETQGWTKDIVDGNVLKGLDPKNIRASIPDSKSVMMYRIPGSITYDGIDIEGGDKIDQIDGQFFSTIFPKKVVNPPVSPPPPLPPPVPKPIDWRLYFNIWFTLVFDYRIPINILKYYQQYIFDEMSKGTTEQVIIDNILKKVKGKKSTDKKKKK